MIEGLETAQGEMLSSTGVPAPHKGVVDDSLVDLAQTGRVLRAGRKQVGLTALFTGGLALLYVLLASPYYTASASFISQSPSNSSSSTMLLSELSSMGASGLLGGASKGSGDLYVGILKSRGVQDRLITRFSLMDVYKVKKQSRAEKELANHTNFDVDTKTSIVVVQVTDESPQRARDLANAYLEELRSVNQRLALTESSQRRLFYEQQLAGEKNALADAEVDLKRSQERTGLIAPAGQTSLEIQSIAQMRAQIASREVQLAALRQSSTDQNPQVVSLSAEISDLRRQLASMQSGKSVGKVGDLAASEVPELGLEYIRKERDVKYHEALFGLLLKQYEAARMDEAREPQLLQMLDPATIPDTKTGPHRMLIVGLAVIVGVLIGSVWVLFQSARKRTSVHGRAAGTFLEAKAREFSGA